MNSNILIAKALNTEDFAPFGDIISVANAAASKTINYSHALRYDTAVALELNAKNGRAGISIFRSTPLPQPVRIERMERHPLSSQAFYPLSGHPYLVVVAPTGDFKAALVRAFIARPDQGVNYHCGVWHHYLLALEGVSDFLVIDRIGPPNSDNNCDEANLVDGPVIMLSSAS